MIKLLRAAATPVLYMTGLYVRAAYPTGIGSKYSRNRAATERSWYLSKSPAAILSETFLLHSPVDEL